MSNIEEMEGIKRNYFELSRPFRKESRDYYIIYFMGFVIDSLKDLHEENCKIWKAIAELQVGDMQKFHDKIYENNLDNRKELNIDDKDNQKD